MGDMMGTKEAARKWGFPQSKVWEWCRAGMIVGAVHSKPGGSWLIPSDAKCPRQHKEPPVMSTPPHRGKYTIRKNAGG